VSHPSVVSNNWIDHDEHVFAIYYFDNGASHYHCTYNVATNSTVAWAYFMTVSFHLLFYFLFYFLFDFVCYN
jgi:hypothetical protein